MEFTTVSQNTLVHVQPENNFHQASEGPPAPALLTENRDVAALNFLHAASLVDQQTRNNDSRLKVAGDATYTQDLAALNFLHATSLVGQQTPNNDSRPKVAGRTTSI